MNMIIASRLAATLHAREHCRAHGNTDWTLRHTETLRRIMRGAPSGAGIDNGTQLDESLSTPDCLVFRTAFHHMDEGGYYSEWTEHTIRARPSFVFGLSLTISGRDRNQIKDHLADVFHAWLTSETE